MSDKRRCDNCRMQMPPFVPRKRKGEQMLCPGCVIDPRRNYASATKTASGDDEHESYYHITDNPHFAPDATKVPHDNALSMSPRERPGLFMTKDPNSWGAAHGYQRPYLAEVHVPKGLGGSERWGNEHFVDGADLHHVKVHRVIPLDEHIRERWGEPGRIESFHGTSHDGRELVRNRYGEKAFKEPLGEGYKYSGPDVRDMSPEQHRQHYERWRDYAVGGGIEGYQFGHNEFDDKKMTLGGPDRDEDYDSDGQFIMRNQHGEETGRKWAALRRTAGMFGPPWYADSPDSEIDSHPRAQGIRDDYIAHHSSPQGHTYRLTHDGHQVYAAYLGKGENRIKKPQMVGALSWFGGRVEPGSNIPGRIHKVFVKPAHRRRGLASAMLDHARAMSPNDDIEHSDALSEDGKAWSSAKASLTNTSLLEADMNTKIAAEEHRIDKSTGEGPYVHYHSQSANGAGPRVIVTFDADHDPQSAMAKAKMEYSKIYGGLPRGLSWKKQQSDGKTARFTRIALTATNTGQRIIVVAHDSGDGETIYHCPFCGSGQVIARSDRTIECEFCHTSFTVQVQPQYSAFPQTINGVPVDVPGMPGQIGGDPAAGGMPVDADGGPVDPSQIGEDGEVADDGQNAVPGDEGEPTEEDDDDKPGANGGNPFAKGSMRTHTGARLDPAAYKAHLALRFADDRERVLARVRAKRKG